MFNQMPLPSEDSRYFGTENATEIMMRKRIPIIKGESERLERRGRRRQKNIGLSLPTSKDRREFFTTLNHVRWNTDQSGFGPKHETQHPDPQRNTTDVKQMASVKQQFIDSTVCIFFFVTYITLFLAKINDWNFLTIPNHRPTTGMSLVTWVYRGSCSHACATKPLLYKYNYHRAFNWIWKCGLYAGHTSDICWTIITQNRVFIRNNWKIILNIQKGFHYMNHSSSVVDWKNRTILKHGKFKTTVDAI